MDFESSGNRLMEDAALTCEVDGWRKGLRKGSQDVDHAHRPHAQITEHELH